MTKINTLYSMYTSYGSKSKVLSGDVVTNNIDDSFAERLDSTSKKVSTSVTTGVPNGFFPAIIVKTEQINVFQIPDTHSKAASALRSSNKSAESDSTTALAAFKHYAVVGGQSNFINLDFVPPELLTIIYELGSTEDTDQQNINRRCIVEILGEGYGIIKSNASAGLQYADGQERPGDFGEFDLNTIIGGKKDKFKRPVITTALQNRNAAILIKLCKENGFNNRQAANFVGMAQGESGLVPRSESGYSGTSVKRIRSVFTSRINSLTDTQIEELKKDDVKFFNYVYHGPVGSKRFEDQKKRRGLGNTVGGYAYRGRGFIQHTGVSNYEVLAKIAGVDYVKNPELLNEIEHASRAFIAYYKQPGFRRKNFNSIVDVYEATFGGEYRDYNEHRRDDIRRRKKMSDHWYKIIISGKWRSFEGTS